MIPIIVQAESDSFKIKILKIILSTIIIFPAMTGVSLLFYVDITFLKAFSKILPILFITLTSSLNGFLTWVLINEKPEEKVKYSILAFTLATAILIAIKIVST